MSVVNLHEWLSYDPATGVFRWKVAPRYRTKPGTVAGAVNGRGYIAIGISGHRFAAHRVAWFLVHGVWPKLEIDHINGDRADNRICNLREATSSQNKQNTRRRIDNASGIKGVDWFAKTHKWRAVIRVGGRQIHLGYFADKQEAAAAYRTAATEYFGQFAKAS